MLCCLTVIQGLYLGICINSYRMCVYLYFFIMLLSTSFSTLGDVVIYFPGFNGCIRIIPVSTFLFTHNLFRMQAFNKIFQYIQD